MVSPNNNYFCEKAKLYYYDFLFLQNKSSIPQEILSHFKTCNNCQKLIYELKTSLRHADFEHKDNNGNQGTPISNMLKLHFSYIDQKITCKIAKPFLPGLLDKSLEISVPTPITTHLDHCPKCVHDLQIISDLNLNNVQLFHLSKLFAAKPDDEIACSQAKSDIMAFVMMAFHESDERILKHFCLCKECRTALYEYRETIRKGALKEKGDNPCYMSSQISNAEIFDFVVPYGMNPLQYKNSEFQKSRISHMRRCPFCLEKMQQLHRTVFEIADRADSEIVTKYNIRKPAYAILQSSSKNLYEDFPIDVKVTNTKEEKHTINFTAALKQKIINSNIKTIARSGFIAVFLFAALLFIQNQSQQARAVECPAFYDNLIQADNVHISSYLSGESKLFQERWVSRSLKIEISKIQNKLILTDIINKKIITTNTDTGTTETVKLSGEKLSYAEISIYGALGLVPFNNRLEFPKDAVWKEIDDNENEIYDLLFTMKSSIGTPIYNKYRYYLVPNTNLPYKVEYYRKYDNDNFELKTIKEIKIISDGEIEDLKNMYFNQNNHVFELILNKNQDFINTDLVSDSAIAELYSSTYK